MIGLRNDRQTGILNGQCGTVEQVNADRQSLEVKLDNDQRIEVGASYLEPGHLDHGYAITAHRAQGATVDRTFVLGSADLGIERDAAPTVDPTIDALQRLLGRSRAQQLASDSLADRDTDELEQERVRLRAELSTRRGTGRAPRGAATRRQDRTGLA